uniref:Si:dkey-56f14.7 n=1 Tax=Sinocyclocheilus grahami TaxID=75366 RepID=A0A672M5D5_SINGR
DLLTFFFILIELREKLQPEVIELIKQQRLNRLCEGTCFRKISARRRQDKFWYCRLSPNHKVLHYGDIEEFSQGQISHDSLQEKVTVADIKAVVMGKDCPHMREKGALKNKVRINYCNRQLISPDRTGLGIVDPNSEHTRQADFTEEERQITGFNSR